MKLMEVTSRIHQLDPEQTIYAKAPWHADSDAVVAVEEQGSLVPEQLARQGFSYFLEVSVASEVIPDLSHVQPSFTLEQWCERLIRYAENDA